MDLKISNIEPKYEDQTVVSEIVSVSGYSTDNTGDYVNGRVTLAGSDLTSGKTFDDLTSKDLLEMAKKKLIFA